MDSAMREIYRRAKGNIVDYGLVMDCLAQYRSPHSKLTQLLRTNDLIRMKKGIYVLGDDFRREDLVMEVVANLMYGPSYVSLEWALQHHGLIPERVSEVTSVTRKRKTYYDTPLGRFSYESCNPDRYPVGIVLEEMGSGQKALMACPEKALADVLVIRRGKMTSIRQIEQVLLEDLRLEEEDISRLELEPFEVLQQVRPHSAISYLIKFLKRL